MCWCTAPNLLPFIYPCPHPQPQSYFISELRNSETHCLAKNSAFPSVPSSYFPLLPHLPTLARHGLPSPPPTLAVHQHSCLCLSSLPSLDLRTKTFSHIPTSILGPSLSIVTILWIYSFSYIQWYMPQAATLLERRKKKSYSHADWPSVWFMCSMEPLVLWGNILPLANWLWFPFSELSQLACCCPYYPPRHLCDSPRILLRTQ